MRIWRNDYQFLFSVRGKWFWACVKTDLGSWWRMDTSSSCSSCKRVQSLCWSCCKLSAPLPSQAPTASYVAQPKGLCDSRPRITTRPVLLRAAVVMRVLVKYHLVFLWLPDWLTCTMVCDARYQVIYYYCWATSAFGWESCLVGFFFQSMCRVSRGSVVVLQLQQLIWLNLIYGIHERPKCGHCGKGAS